MADLSESVLITAAAEDVYALVCDLPRMGEWSPENRGARWLGRSGSTRQPVPGARFIGFNRYRWLRWPTHGRVTVADPPRAFAFEVVVGPIPIARWAYEIRSATPAGAVELIESWIDRRPRVLVPALNRIFGASREELNTRGMRVTLQNIKQAIEHDRTAGPDGPR